MTLKTRRFLFVIFILLFLFLAPTMIIYANGYRLKLSWPLKFDDLLQKTGMLIIESKPSGAKIFLDQKTQKNFLDSIINKKSFAKTPAKLKGIYPKEYNIRLELDGYWDWQEKITIKPGESIYLQNIQLFKKEIPTQVVNNKNLIDSKISPDKNYIALLDEEKISIVDLKNNLIKKELTLKNDLLESEMTWSSDGKKILLDNKVFFIDDSLEIDLTKEIKEDFYNLKWVNNNEGLYFQTDNGVYSFNLNNKKSQEIIKSANFTNYQIKENYLVLVSNVQQENKLKIISLNGNTTIREINIPGSEDYTFIEGDNQYVNLLDKKHEIFYLINPMDPVNPVKRVIDNVKNLEWISKNIILYNNTFEIWLFDSENNKRILLNRISENISGLAWHPKLNHIVYTTTKSINILELNQGKDGKRTITEISRLDKIKNPYISNDSESLYFLAQIGNQAGLYKLNIK